MLHSNFSLLKEMSQAKMGTSFVNICDEIFPVAKEVARGKNGFENAIDLLFHLEKLTRNANHFESNVKVLIEIVDMNVTHNRWKELNNYIVLLANRRMVIKKSIVTMVRHCLTLLDKPKIQKDQASELTKTLYSITEGKNYLEIERAKLAKLMADHNEQENNIDEAIKILEDLKCETIANMDAREKIKLQLQLIRLLIVKQDFIKAQILSKKILTKFLEQPEQEDLKLNYYNLKITLDHIENFLTTSKHYQAILNCYGEKDPMKLKILGNAVLYCSLAPYDNEQKENMEILLRNKLLERIPNFKTFLETFLSKEIIDIDNFMETFKKDMYMYPVLDCKTNIGRNNWIQMRNRLLEHNIMVIASYYQRIYLKRMSEILKVHKMKCEECISHLVTEGRISAKIDRLSGIVNFSKAKQIDEILNDWAYDLKDLMSKVNDAYHVVNKIQCTSVPDQGQKNYNIDE